MNKKQLAERLARQSHRSRAQAADSVDKLVYGILKDLRSNERPDANTTAAQAVPPTANLIPAPKKDRPSAAGESKKRKS